MITKLFGKKTKEIFTLFIPCSKNPYLSYREKKLDSTGQLFNKHDISFTVRETISHEKGFWVIFELTGSEKSFLFLRKDPLFRDYLLYEGHIETEPHEELEIIDEDHADFSNVDNFQV